jgi:DNA-binding NarL/FixJ family response regulator
MINNYFSKFNIVFTGFEKRIQQSLEFYLIEKLDLLEKTEIINENTNEELKVHIFFITNISDINNYNFKNSTTVNERVLCIVDFDDFGNLLSCVQTGCYGCIPLSNIFEELTTALISVLQNKIYISAAFAATIHEYFKGSSTPCYGNLFTNREHKLIKLLTTGALYKEIAWKMRISENTVRSHVRNIYGKLKVHSKTELTQKILNGNLITSTIYFLSDYIACLCY